MPDRKGSGVRLADGGSAPARRAGRPSVALARRREIIEAYTECIRRHGIAGATVDKVAQAMGVSRTLIFHYFGDMPSLTRAAAEDILSTSVRHLTEGRRTQSPAARREALLDYAVAGPHFAELRDVVVLAELTSLAGRDPTIAAMLSEIWRTWIQAVVDELAACFPAADPARRASVGYALACLGEQHWWLTFIGPGAQHGPDVRMAAKNLMSTLQIPGEAE